METKTCPHCNNQIPPEFAVMPVCTMCGGDLNAQPTTQQWASLDINEKKTFQCPSCQYVIESVLVTECSGCQSSLDWIDGQPVISSPSAMPTHPPEPTSSIKTSEPSIQTPQKPVSEGFIAKLLRFLGLKK